MQNICINFKELSWKYFRNKFSSLKKPNRWSVLTQRGQGPQDEVKDQAAAASKTYTWWKDQSLPCLIMFSALVADRFALNGPL